MADVISPIGFDSRRPMNQASSNAVASAAVLAPMVRTFAEAASAFVVSAGFFSSATALSLISAAQVLMSVPT